MNEKKINDKLAYTHLIHLMVGLFGFWLEIRVTLILTTLSVGKTTIPYDLETQSIKKSWRSVYVRHNVLIDPTYWIMGVYPFCVGTFDTVESAK